MFLANDVNFFLLKANTQFLGNKSYIFVVILFLLTFTVQGRKKLAMFVVLLHFQLYAVNSVCRQTNV